MRALLFAIWLTLAGPVVVLQAQIRINEILALNPYDQENPVTGLPGDWIEIRNTGSSDFNLTGYFLTDNPGNLTKWKFPSEITIPAGGYLLLLGLDAPDTGTGLHVNFNLDAGGECLRIYSPVAGVTDSMAYPRQYEAVSYGLLPGGEPAFFHQPTPGALNDVSSSFRMAGPVLIDPPGGIFSRGQGISMTGEPGSTIHYTTDGSDPGESDPVYSEPLFVTSDHVIRARQYVSGKQPSEPATASYLFKNVVTIPVVSLATDPVNLWDDEIGIHVSGTNGIPGYCSDLPRNWNQDWERPVHMEYFDKSGKSRVHLDCGIKIHGGCSRQAALKSFGIFARNEYGTNHMDYRFFSDKQVDEFKGLVLRNAGNDNQYTYIRDAVIQAAVCRDMNVDYQSYDPVHVYLNGEYWGIMNLREKVNEHWVTSNYGITAENLDFLKNQWEVFAGSRNAWDDLMNFMEQHSLANQANYEVVEAQLDIPSYIDYLVTEMFFANRDWPGNNLKYWRDRVRDTRWRFILFDMEFSMGLYDYDPAIDMFEFSTADEGDDWPNPSWATLPIRKLLENEGFRQQFLQKYMMYLNSTLQSSRVIGVIDSIQGHIAPVMPGHIDRWHLISNTDVWNNNVEQLRRFARERPGYVWSNMQRFFSLGASFPLEIAPAGPQGTIIANGIRVPAEGISGKYEGGIGLDLEFEPSAGYLFSHWKISTGQAVDTTLVRAGSVWKYNDSGIDPGQLWNQPEFDDSGWDQGPGELGYGDGDESTTLGYGDDEANKYLCYWFRKDLTLSDPSLFGQFTFRIIRDDGAVVYVNGKEVWRDNMPEGPVLPDTPPLAGIGGADESAYNEFSVDRSYFVPGRNTLAVEIHQVNGTSSDISFDLEIDALKTMPGSSDFTTDQNPLHLDPVSATTVSIVTEEVELDLELVINEVMASNQGAWLDEFGNSGDWIEIYNPGNEAVDMAGLYFTDSLEWATRWRIPSSYPEKTTIGPGDFLIFIADGDPEAGPMHLSFKLDSYGEGLGLSYMSGNRVVWIDSLHFLLQVPNQSMGRYPDGVDDWHRMINFTPGSSNIYTSVEGSRDLEKMITVFPNPASDLLHIRMENGIPGSPAENVHIRMMDLSGRILIETYLDLSPDSVERELKLNSLSPGIYLLMIQSASLQYTGRIVVLHSP